MAKADINARLGLDSSGFERGMQRSKKSLSRFGKGVVGVANKLTKIGLTSAAAGFVMLSRSAIKLGSELSDIAISTGFATEEFQVFRGALLDAGGEAKSMEKAILVMQKAVVQGSEGLTTYVRAFERLGLNVEDLRAMKPEEQFETIGRAIAGAKDKQGALTAAIEIFGQRNAPRLIEVFKRLDKDGYGKMAEDIKKAYGVMDEQTQKALDKASDTIERFKNKSTIYVADLISGIGLEAKLKKIGLRLAQFMANVTVELLAFSPVIPDSWFDKWKGAINKHTDKFVREQDVIIAKEKRMLAEKEKAAEGVADAQKPVTEAIDKTTGSINDQETAIKSLEDQIKEYYKKVKDAIDIERERFINSKELEALQLRAKGEKAAAEELESKIESMKKAIEISNKYEISLLKAVNLVKNINRAEKESTGGGDGGDLEWQKKLMDMKLAALKAETRGEDALAEALRNRIKLAERILEIMNETGATKREAIIIANKQIKAELSGGGGSTGGGSTGGGDGGGDGGGNYSSVATKLGELTGADLRRAANAYAKSLGKDMRFARNADGTFNKYKDGWRVGNFTEEQLQSGLRGGPEAERSEKDKELERHTNILKSIEKELKGT